MRLQLFPGERRRKPARMRIGLAEKPAEVREPGSRLSQQGEVAVTLLARTRTRPRTLTSIRVRVRGQGRGRSHRHLRADDGLDAVAATPVRELDRTGDRVVVRDGQRGHVQPGGLLHQRLDFRSAVPERVRRVYVDVCEHRSKLYVRFCSHALLASVITYACWL